MRLVQCLKRIRILNAKILSLGQQIKLTFCDEEINIYHYRKCLKSDHLNTITLIILEMEHCIMAGSIVNRYTLSIYINDILEKLFNKIFFEELSSVQNFEQKKM